MAVSSRQCLIFMLVAAAGVFAAAPAVVAQAQTPATNETSLEPPEPMGVIVHGARMPGDGAGVTSAVAGGVWEAVFFYVIAAAAVVTSLGVCISRNIVRMAVWLFGALGCVALLYFLLAANFLAAIQLIVYAGGTLVLLIFGVMLTSKSPWVRFEARFGEIFAAAMVCLLLLVTLGICFVYTAWPEVRESAPGASVADFGRQLMTTYLIPFEIAGVLLMVVMVGAAHLAREDQQQGRQ
ncbi:MAG: NADH-quinone oxidoreductase subunit J [Phycisphaerae bacterium]|nr:NADH-quinone oxidoreductase subunit J [Phycisphaerae bacterium]